MSDQYVEKHWREINCRTTIDDTTFRQGLKDFKFSVGQGYGFIPAQSYFRVDLEITVAGNAPTVADNAAFADNVCGNLFNNIYFNMGGQTVSHITNGVAQCDILKNRLTKNCVYNKSIGMSQGLAGHHFDRRKLLVDTANGTVNITDAQNNVKIVTGIDANGDVVYGAIANLNTSIADVENKAKEESQTGRNRRFFIWQPALGIFDYSQPLGAGEYEIQLNPSQDYRLSGIDTSRLVAGKTVAGDAGDEVNLKIREMRFYACMCRVNLPSSGEEILHLMEMDVYTANLNTGTVNLNEEFTVPSSTRALTLFMQDQKAGKDTSVPPSRFHNVYDSANDEVNRDALTLQNYQIEYGNMTKPTIRFESKFDDTTQQLYQRYIQTALESGQYFQLTGAETFEEWMERGPIFHETFVKSADNLATRVHVVGQYGTVTGNCRAFLIAHYSRTIKITRQNGLVVNVQSLNV